MSQTRKVKNNKINLKSKKPFHAHTNRLQDEEQSRSDKKGRDYSFCEQARLWLYDDPGPNRAVPLLAILTFLLFIPFCGKAFHVDDTLFLKAAHQIISHPLDPYGFIVNWRLTEMPMADVMKNPPLASYYIALIASLLGWSEEILHIAFLPFTIAAVLGVYNLARHMKAPPVLASLAFLLSPIFMVSSTNIMCDTMMVAFYIWAIIFWIEGIKNNSSLRIISAILLAIIAVFTKYFALSVFILMLIYVLMSRRKIMVSLGALVIPIVILFGYQQLTASLYGHGLLTDAAEYANFYRKQAATAFWGNIIVGIGFLGATLPCIFLLAPKLYRIPFFIGGFIVAFTVAFLVTSGIIPAGSPPVFIDKLRLFFTLQMSILITMGFFIIATILTVWKLKNDPDLILLVLWCIGTLTFSWIINWSINARSIMPIGPAAAILFARLFTIDSKPAIQWTMASLLCAAILSLSVCWGDYRLANTGREAASRILSIPNSNTVWFQGHWGFQYYLEAGGAKSLDPLKSRVEHGDLLVVPSNNTSPFPINQELLNPLESIDLIASRWVTTTHGYFSAGFYAHIMGPLPFVFGPVPLEHYYVLRFR